MAINPSQVPRSLQRRHHVFPRLTRPTRAAECASASIAARSRKRHRYELATMLLSLGAMAIPPVVESPFCHEANGANLGCDAACGFVRNSTSGRCVSLQSTRDMTPHCQRVKLENQGCSSYCGNHATSEGTCIRGTGHEQGCDDVEKNFGCDPACGFSYGRTRDKYVHEGELVRHGLHHECSRADPGEVARVVLVPYCKLISQPPHSGCCLACGFFWSDEHDMCMQRIMKEEL